MNFIREITDCFKWYRHWGTLPVLSWIRAADLFRNGDYISAVSFYEAGLKKHLSHPAKDCAQFDLAYCYYRIGKLDLARTLLAELVQKRVDLKEAYLLLSRIRKITGHIVSSRVVLELANQIFYQDAQVLSCLAHASVFTDLSDDEIDNIKYNLLDLKNEVDLQDSNYLHIETALANIEIRRGDLKKGERLLSRVLSTGEAPYEAILIRAQRLLETGRLVIARNQLERVAAACPRDPKPLILLARSYLRTGVDYNLAWAKQLTQSACQLSNWQNAECLSLLSRIYEEDNQPEVAEMFNENIKSLSSNKELNVSYYTSSLVKLKSSNS